MRARLSVGAEGEVVLPGEEATGLGVAGGGEVDVVSARGAFALVTPARDEAPRAWFAGSLAALTVPEVIQLVATSLKTGVLLLSFGGEAERAAPEQPDHLRRRSVYFRDGQVVFASSSDPADRLGPALVRAGLLAEEDLARCAPLVRGGRPLGQVLVDHGILSAGKVYEGLIAQVREIVLGACTETSGTFAFVEGPHDERNAVKLPERTRDLLLAGMKRLEGAERLRAAEAPPEPAAEEDEIVVEVEPPAPADRARASGPFETYRRIFKRVYAALAATQPDAGDRLNSYFERLPAKQRPIFDGVRVGADGEMDVAQVLVNVSATGAYRGAAAKARSLEALEDLLAFALFEVKNCLPKADADALLREVGRMQVGKA